MKVRRWFVSLTLLMGLALALTFSPPGIAQNDLPGLPDAAAQGQACQDEFAFTVGQPDCDGNCMEVAYEVLEECLAAAACDGNPDCDGITC